jgi:DNA-directed RNA polymerase subunit omega
MYRPSSAELLKKNESYYSLVVAVAKRARSIVEDAEIEGRIVVEKPVALAVGDFSTGKCMLVEKANIGCGIE